MRNVTAAKSSKSHVDVGTPEHNERARHAIDYTPDALALTVADAAAIAGIGKTLLYRALQTKQLPARKLGRRTLILRKDLDQWLTTLPRWAGFPERRIPPSQRSS